MGKEKSVWRFGPWLCAITIVTAMVLGMLADGFADGIAGVLLVVPSGIVFHHLLRRA